MCIFTFYKMTLTYTLTHWPKYMRTYQQTLKSMNFWIISKKKLTIPSTHRGVGILLRLLRWCWLIDYLAVCLFNAKNSRHCQTANIRYIVSDFDNFGMCLNLLWNERHVCAYVNEGNSGKWIKRNGWQRNLLSQHPVVDMF